MNLNNLSDIKNMPFGQYINWIKSADESKLVAVINSNLLDDLSDQFFNAFFLVNNLNIKAQIINDPKRFKRLIETPPNKSSRHFLELLDVDTLKLMIDSQYSTEYLYIITNFLKKISTENFNQIIDQIDFLKLFPDNCFLKSPDKLNDFLAEQNIDQETKQALLNGIKSKKFSPLCFLRDLNETELLLLSKFDLLINASNENNEIIINQEKFPYDLIKNLNYKHLSTLAKTFKNKNLDNDYDIIIATIRLYCLFGYDNALKIINDKFTYLTESSKTRICDTFFKNIRRTFRLKHQNKFYYYGLEDDILIALQKTPLDLEFFNSFVFQDSPEEAKKLVISISTTIRGKSYHEQKDLIKEIIINRITEREKAYKKDYIESLNKSVLAHHERKPLCAKEINVILKNLDLSSTVLDSKKQVIPNSDIQKFLLGNLKQDNDALFRLVINKQALGLNNALAEVLNQFDLFKRIINHSYGKLSLYSILDIIDIFKTNLYHMEPDEQDITLETLSKIIKSKEYCQESEAELVKRAFDLHRKRKLKISSSIPSITGFYEDYLYQVAPFDAENLLCSGIDSDNCLKIGGKGEELLTYCLTSHHAVLLYIYSPSKKTFICPIIRSGNGIHINGIDPEPEDNEKATILKILQKCFKEISELSTSIVKNPEQSIEIGTVTDLHMPYFMANTDFELYDFEKYIPLDAVLYSDYNKDEIQNYVLFKADTYTKNHYYLSDDTFFQPRHPVFKYNISKEFNQQEVSTLINGIAYTSIDPYLENTRSQRQKKKDFEPINIEDFLYIIGNKDWFIAIEKDFSLVEYLLPYDPRAREEYYQNYAKINGFKKELQNDIDEEVGKTKLKKL